MKRINVGWRLVQGCAASVLVAAGLAAAGIPYNYHGCAFCRANFPEWFCFFECLFG